MVSSWPWLWSSAPGGELGSEEFSPHSGCLGTKSGAWALISEGVTAGESQRTEGASGRISGSCTSNRKSGLRKEQRARRCNGLPSSFAWASMLDGYYVC